MDDFTWEERQGSWFAWTRATNWPGGHWEARRLLAFWEYLIGQAEQRLGGPVQIVAVVNERAVNEEGPGPMRIGARFDLFPQEKGETQA